MCAHVVAGFLPLQIARSLRSLVGFASLRSLARWLASLARFARFASFARFAAHTLTWDKCRTKILDCVGGGFRAASDSINNIIRPRVGLTAPIARLLAGVVREHQNGGAVKDAVNFGLRKHIQIPIRIA